MSIAKRKITPCLWFDTQGEEAANYYASIFKNARIGHISRYGKAGNEIHGRTEGSVMTVEFELDGQPFVALNGGPHFKFNEAVSFQVFCDSQDEIDHYWGKLSAGGQEGSYGWLKDKFGLSWQIVRSAVAKRKITPCLWFDTQAEEAANYYVSILKNARIGHINRYGKAGKEIHGRAEGTVMTVGFELDGQPFVALNGGPQFKFDEAVSFQVFCDSQDEVDHYWGKLSAGGQEGPCGWLKDKFGLSWQVVPSQLIEMLSHPNSEKTERVTGAFLQMKKFDIAALKRAYAG
jgi:predicted 3-demethylubiquinone-9 3-methyltransferase (glyoxalase superfamily)